MKRLAAVLLLFAGCASGPAPDGFAPLFNGTDLAGWVRVNCSADTFTVRDGVIVCSGVPTGILRTAKQYENFILELEWMHTKADGNAGLFVHSDPLPAVGSPFTRAIEVQVMLGDNPDGSWTGQGDVFSIWGAHFTPDRPHPKGWERCLPSERRMKPADEWNHYRVESNDGRLTLAVNGAVVSGGTKCNPRKGYLCLESEGSLIYFRNLRIKELPSTGAVAAPAEDFVPLEGWQMEAGHKDHWKFTGTVISYDGKSTAKDPCLWTEKEYGDVVLIADWRFTRKPVDVDRPVIGPDGAEHGTQKVKDAGDSGIYLRGSSKSQVNIWCWPCGSGEVYGYRTDGAMSADVRAGVTPKSRADKPPGQWNRFVITMKGDRLTVELNGVVVIENAQLPGVAAKGKIALQHHGDPIEFTNLFVREMR